MDAFERLHPDIKRVLWDMRWESLRSLQSDSIHAWLDTDADLLLMAQTAAGKTEAAFLPILSGMAADRGAGSFRAIYVGPLKALINDQFRRLEKLCDIAEIPVHRWHGDVDAGKKAKAIKNPAGVLLITPESLEAMFMLRGRLLPALFSRLEAVVIDELHVFLDSERGRQLSSLLNRLDLAKGSRVRRVGLSATIGSPEAALEWLAGAPERGRLLKAEGESELALLIKTFFSDPAPPNSNDQGEDEDDGSGGLIGIARHLHDNFRGKTNLVFCNRKNQIESLSDLLARHAKRERVSNQFRVHHGSLSREIRQDVEAELQSGRPCTALCSSTLELGIDVGGCDAVGQVEPPHSVSALRQRLGRSGRREGATKRLWMYVPLDSPARDARLSYKLHFPLIRAIAEVELMLEGWVEPVTPNVADLSTLTQQVLSTIRQTGGAHAHRLFETVCSCPAFRSVDSALFANLLRDLGKADLIEQTPTGDLILGLKGEKLTSHYEFYAAFESADEWDVVHGKRAIGSIVPSPLYAVGSHMLLAGKRWTIKDIDEERRAYLVQPSGKKLPVIFPGWSGHVHRRIREKMLEVLLDDRVPRYVDGTSAKALKQARATAKEHGLAPMQWTKSGDEQFLVTLAGSRENATLGAFLTRCGVEARTWPGHRFELGLAFDSKPDTPRVAQLLRQFAQDPPDLPRMCIELHRPAVPPVGKHTHFLGNELRATAYVSSNYDLQGALNIAGRLRG